MPQSRCRQSSEGKKTLLNVCRTLEPTDTFEFVAFNTKLPEMAMLASKEFTPANKLPSVGLNLMITGSRV